MAKTTIKLDLFSLAKKASSNTSLVRAWQKIISEQPSFSIEYGKRFIDEMVDRTQLDFLDKNDRRFKSYKKGYVESDIFEIYGKEKNEVNMTLTGQMLASIDVRVRRPGKPEIFFLNKDREEIASFHIDGTPVMPKRDFFGLTEEKQIKIFKDLVREFNDLDQDVLNTDAKQVTQQNFSIEEPGDEL